MQLSADQVSLEPGDYLAWGLQALDDGDLQGATQHLRRSIFLHPESPLAHFGLGLALLQLGEPSRARSATVQGQRLLAALPDEQVVPGSQAMLVGELRHALEAQLQALERGSTTQGARVPR